VYSPAEATVLPRSAMSRPTTGYVVVNNFARLVGLATSTSSTAAPAPERSA
jgi:hypothetical protein